MGAPLIDANWQVVLWGYRPSSTYYHTHAHIHKAWKRAFEHLGYSTKWLADGDDVSGVNFERTLFITAGDEQEREIPLRQDCFYAVHNCTYEKYRYLPHLVTNTFTDAVLDRRGHEKLEDCMYFDGEVLYLIWATDLLPHEIDAMKPASIDLSSKDDYFIGTVGSSTAKYGNSDELLLYKLACDKNDIRFWFKGGFSGTPMSDEENAGLIRKALFAPTIVGKWQHDVGYVPCRIFKNISYGKFGVTNSPRVQELFGGRLVQNSDCYQLFYDARARIETLELAELHALMDWVKERHTYLNRVSTLLGCANRRLAA